MHHEVSACHWLCIWMFSREMWIATLTRFLAASRPLIVSRRHFVVEITQSSKQICLCISDWQARFCQRDFRVSLQRWISSHSYITRSRFAKEVATAASLRRKVPRFVLETIYYCYSYYFNSVRTPCRGCWLISFLSCCHGESFYVCWLHVGCLAWHKGSVLQ